MRIASHGVAARAAASGVEPGAAQHVVGPHQGEVAEQDGGRRAEPGRPAAPGGGGVPAGERDVHRRAAAARGGGVHQVVVHERAGLDQLQRGDGAQHRVDLRTLRVATRPRQPHQAKVGRMRLPPPSTKSQRSPAAAPKAGSMAAAAARRRSRKSARACLEPDGQVQVGGVQAGLGRSGGGGAHGRSPRAGTGERACGSGGHGAERIGAATDHGARDADVRPLLLLSE